MEALKSIIPIVVGLGILLTWSASKKYTIAIKSIVTVILVAVFCASWFVWPGRPFTGNGGYSTPSSFSSDGNVILTISGSMVMSDELAPKLAKSYMEENDYENVKIEDKDNVIEISGTLKGKKESIIVLPTSNKNGIRALDDNKTDIALSTVESPENSAFEEKEVGMDAICVVTSTSNTSIKDLTAMVAANIFEGIYSTHLNIYCMDDSNEYREFFEKEFMYGKSICRSAKIFKDEKELLSALSKDPDGIGLIDYEFAKTPGIKVVPIRDSDDYPPMLPNDITVQNEDYPLAMRIYMYSLTKTKNEHVQKFLDWIENDEGQEIVEKSGRVVRCLPLKFFL